MGDWLRIRPSVWIRQDLYLGEVSAQTDQRGYAVADVLVSSEVSRTFDNGLRHAIQPSLQFRAIPGQWGAVPGTQPTAPNQPVENRFYDEIDGAIFQAPLYQGVLRLGQTLSRRTGAVMQELLRLDLAQEFDFETANGLADTVVGLRGGVCAVQRRAHASATTTSATPRRSGPPSPRMPSRASRPRVRFDQLFVPVQFFDRDVGVYPFAQNLTGQVISAADLARFGGGGNMRQGIDQLVGSPVPANFRTGQRQSAITLDGTGEPRLRARAHLLGDAVPGGHLDGPQPERAPSPPARRTPVPVLTPTVGVAQNVVHPPATGQLQPARAAELRDLLRPGVQLLAAGHHRPAPAARRAVRPGPPEPGAFYVPSTFNWRFPDLIFLLTIQSFGTFGAS